jgi:signal transduction histidine kinase
MTLAARRARPQTASSAETSRLVAPVLLLLLVSTVMLGFVTLIAARSLDEQAAASQRRLAQAMLKQNLRHMAKQAYDYAWWNDMAAHAVPDVDPEWADGNVGSYVHKAYGFASSWVVGPGDETYYGFIDGAPAGRKLADWGGAALAPLIEATRRSSMAEPEPQFGLARLGGEAHFVGVCAVTPERPEGAALLPRPRPVLVFTKRLDAALLADAAAVYGLPELRLQSAPPPAQDYDFIPLTDPRGDSLGVLAWRLHRPGRDLLRQVWPALVSALAAMLLLGGLFVRRAQQSGRRQKRLAAALERERELRELKSRFVNMASHEIRTPLTTIRAASDLLLRYGERMTPEERGREIGAIQREVAQLASLVEDVLAIGRAERDDRPLKAQMVDIEEAARTHWSRAEAALGRRLPLILAVAPDARRARLDPDLLRAILVNIFQNAIKFTPSGLPAELEVARADGVLTIALRDRGVGVPSDELDAVFDPFHRAANVGAVSGSGLGHANVREAAQRHGGAVALRPRDGGGAEIRLTLREAPVEDDAAAAVDRLQAEDA